MFECLIIMLFFTLPPVSFAVYKKRFRALGLTALAGLGIGVPWDMISAGYFHTWSWNDDTLVGLWIGPLPLEEYLFMALVPMMLIGVAIVLRIDLHLPENNRKRME